MAKWMNQSERMTLKQKRQLAIVRPVLLFAKVNLLSALNLIRRIPRSNYNELYANWAENMYCLVNVKNIGNHLKTVWKQFYDLMGVCQVKYFVVASF